MQGTTGRWGYQTVQVLFGWAVVSMIGLSLLGQVREEISGYALQPVMVVGCVKGRRCERRERCRRARMAAMGGYLRQSWRPVLLRSLVLWGLWESSGHWGPAWLRLAPWGLWLWCGLGVGWPEWREERTWRWVHGGLWQGQRMLLVGYMGMVLSQGWREGTPDWVLGLGWMVDDMAADSGSQEGPWVEVERQEDGSYQASLCGHFTLQVAGDEPFRMRLLVLFLSLLDAPGKVRGSRRTRDGRTPFVRQIEMAQWFGVPQPNISRWLRYWHGGEWADLLSLHSPQVLTTELRVRIVEVCATFPSWGVEQVYHHLRQQGVAVTQDQVQQTVEQSGWQQLQQTLSARYALGESTLRLRDEWLVGQLLGQIRELLESVETQQSLPCEVRTTLDDLTTLAVAAGATPPSCVKAVPWLLRVEHVLFTPWELLTGSQETETAPREYPSGEDEAKAGTGQVRCSYCGSDQVGRKSATPRAKKYYDETQQLRQVAVYRYYCRNPQCAKQSFTHLPPGLVPYSPYRTEMHLLAVQMYAWGYSTYRRTGASLGVTSLTAWRWVSAWGHNLLPVAALFGMVKSSGVVGVDEKYVLVPKNDKEDAAMRRWMYVYLAVDVWTYDLLHIAIYAHNNADSAQAFLLALRTKGYHPHVIVTDLRQDYGPFIAQLFPQAVHHECIFHALQDIQRHVKDVYGRNYAENRPEAAVLKQQIYAIFDAEIPHLAHERYTAVLALRHSYVQATPQAAAIFDFLERHWPKLLNGIGSTLIPTTNNSVELVIRRFDQHYQNFCGFESIQHAQRYLAVFEKVYRFTPFSHDARPAIRDKSPLQLAGYDVAHLPITTIFAGLSILWPIPAVESDHVPSP